MKSWKAGERSSAFFLVEVFYAIYVAFNQISDVCIGSKWSLPLHIGRRYRSFDLIDANNESFLPIAASGRLEVGIAFLAKS